MARRRSRARRRARPGRPQRQRHRRRPAEHGLGTRRPGRSGGRVRAARPALAAPGRLVGRARGRPLVEHGGIEAQRLARTRPPPLAARPSSASALPSRTCASASSGRSRTASRSSGSASAARSCMCSRAAPRRTRAWRVARDAATPRRGRPRSPRPTVRGADEARGQRGLDGGLARRGEAELQGAAAGRHAPARPPRACTDPGLGGRRPRPWTARGGVPWTAKTSRATAARSGASEPFLVDDVRHLLRVALVAPLEDVDHRLHRAARPCRRRGRARGAWRGRRRRNDGTCAASASGPRRAAGCPRAAAPSRRRRGRAPASHPSFRARASAFSSTTGPREVLTRYAVGFMRRSRRSSMRWKVGSAASPGRVRFTWRVTKSAFARPSSNGT